MKPCVTVSPEPGHMPCWEVVVDPDRCPDAPTHAVLRIHRSNADVPPVIYAVMRCFTGCFAP